VPPSRIPVDDVTYPDHMRAVYFPTAKAQAARAVCDRIAALLNDHLLARAEMVAGARDGWEGTFRTEFDDTWSVQETRLDGLKQDLQRLSGTIGTAISNADTINAQRAALRQDYRSSRTTATTGPAS
jgi:hypothetical protein